MHAAKNLFSYRKFWAARFGPAPFLPMSRAEMDELGWDSCDIILVTGDAYIDHPSFGMAIIGRLLEAQGFRVGIIAQPDWTSAEAFKALGKPNLFFGVTAGNMDSMVNHYTSDRRLRRDDSYTPGGVPGRRPDRAVIVYAQRCREGYKNAAIMIGGIEASLRRIAQFDHWSEKVRRSILVDSKADILLYGNAERALVEVAHRAAKGEKLRDMRDVRGTSYILDSVPGGWAEVAPTLVDEPVSLEITSPLEGEVGPKGRVGGLPPRAEADDDSAPESSAPPDPALTLPIFYSGANPPPDAAVAAPTSPPRGEVNEVKTVIRLPAYDQVQDDKALYAHASRILHLESNPGNARPLVQRHGDKEVWLTAPPIPLTTAEMDGVYDLPYARSPHPSYGDAKIPAWEMIRFSVNIMRGCFGGCSFCSITEHEGRIIQNRSEASILREIGGYSRQGPGLHRHHLRPRRPDGQHVSAGLQGRKEIETVCRRPSCVFPDVCKNLNTDHSLADRALPQGPRDPGREEDPYRLGPALRPRGQEPGICEGAGGPPCRRLSEDRAGAYRDRAARQDDEARHGQPMTSSRRCSTAIRRRRARNNI